MIKFIVSHYNTYINTSLQTREPQLYRVCFLLISSLFFALFGADNVINVYSIMATGITVLTGFTFTALFSNQALGSSGLPPPKNENDRQDLIRLNTLTQNFRTRSSFFITISILEIVLLAAASAGLSDHYSITSWVPKLIVRENLHVASITDYIRLMFMIFAICYTTILNCIYLESLYTFYRMAETIFAILDIKKEYLDSRREIE